MKIKIPTKLTYVKMVYKILYMLCIIDDKYVLIDNLLSPSAYLIVHTT